MIYERIKFTSSKLINEIDPDYIYKLKNKVYAGYAFRSVIPVEYDSNGKLVAVNFCYDDIDEDNPSRKVLQIATKNVDLVEKKSGRSLLVNYEKIIDEYTAPGREFVSSIPRAFGPDGRVVSMTLVFYEYLE